MTTTLLQVDGISRTYRRGAERVQALDGASFTLERGGSVVLTGPSGSGKTTLLNILAGWEAADAGTIRWSDPAVEPAAPRWAALSMAPQRLGLLPELTIRENVDLPLRLAPDRDHRDDHERTEEMLERFGLTAMGHRMPWEASLGEQQRCALARALVLSPHLVLADEPTGHQDAGWAADVLGALEEATETGSSVLIATHDETVIARARRRLDLDEGRLTPR